MRIIIPFMLTVLFPALLNAQTMKQDTSLLQLLPEAVASWHIEEQDTYHTDVELYDYINGGAELYLNYGFRQLARRVYQLEGKGTLKAEIFHMSSPENAFGVFSYSRDSTNIAMGQGGQLLGKSLIFWQDEYFVSIFARMDKEESEQPLREAGQKISQAIGEKAELPEFFHLLPEQNLARGTAFYFHHPAWQNKFHYIAAGNIFMIDAQMRTMLAKYGSPGNRYFLMLLEYADTKTARKARKNSRKQLPAGLKKHQTAQNKDGRWAGLRQEGKLLIAVFDAPTRDSASYLLSRSAEKYANSSH